MWKQAGRGISLSAAARPAYRRGLGFNVATGELLCREAQHLAARDIGIATRSDATLENEDTVFSSISKLLRKHGDSQAVGTFGRSEGKCHLNWQSNYETCCESVNVSTVSNQHCYGDYSGLQWQKRGISSLDQATKASYEQKPAVVSRSDGNVGGQGQLPPSQPLDGNLEPTSEEEVSKSFVLCREFKFFTDVFLLFFF